MPRRRPHSEKSSPAVARDPNPSAGRRAGRAAARLDTGPRVRSTLTREQERDYAAAHEWRWRLIWAPFPRFNIYGSPYPWAGVLIRWEEDVIREMVSVAPNRTYAGKYQRTEAGDD